MNNTSAAEILTVLCKHEVPLQHSVALLCKVQGKTLTDIAEASGFHRNLLYKALSGGTRPNSKLQKAVEQALDINPWLYIKEQ